VRVFLVTGASSGIGRAIVHACAREFPDAHFVLTARREDALRETAARAGLTEDRVEFVVLDIASANAAEVVLDRARQRFGRLDVLVNNAGIGIDSEFEDPAHVDAMQRLVDVNLLAPMRLSRASLDLLEATGGSIVNISSVAGLVGPPRSPAYSASKWGLTGFGDSLRARVASRGIHVATIHPGPVPTPGWPHHALTSRWYAKPLHCDADTIARAVVHAIRTRAAMLVRPRLYAVVPLLRVVAPGLVRALLRAAARAAERGRT
jgi:short-subunit dehydrogenase